MPEFTRPTTLAEAQARKEAYRRAIADLDWQDQPQTSSGCFSINEMWVVFNKVANPTNWKLPINIKIELAPEEVSILERAIPHFTGGGAAFVPDRMKGDNWWRVTAPGYYTCIGA